MAATASNKILIAGLLGFAAGILYAPRKGSETQEKLKAHIEDMKSDMEAKAQKAKSKIHNMKKHKEESALDKVNRRVDELAERVVP